MPLEHFSITKAKMKKSAHYVGGLYRTRVGIALSRQAPHLAMQIQASPRELDRSTPRPTSRENRVVSSVFNLSDG